MYDSHLSDRKEKALADYIVQMVSFLVIINDYSNVKVKPSRPKLKFYLFPLTLFPLTRPTLKKGPTQKKLFQFSVKNYIF